jgi:hypothetical protein
MWRLLLAPLNPPDVHAWLGWLVERLPFLPATALVAPVVSCRRAEWPLRREAASLLHSEESQQLLVKAVASGGKSALATVSVQWQRQLLEHHGIQMDFGCRALGETPMRFGSDTEVMTAFEGFAQTCMMSVKRACVHALVDK